MYRLFESLHALKGKGGYGRPVKAPNLTDEAYWENEAAETNHGFIHTIPLKNRVS